MSTYHSKYTGEKIDEAVEKALVSISQNDLQSATDSALAQAKASGEFDGADGAAGKDGVSCTHSWSGTTLTVTSASGSTSANLKGEKGNKGDTGEAGHTPVKGTDYWTAADKAAMVSDVLAALPAAEGVSV